MRGSWSVALRLDHDVRVGGGVAEPALDKYAHSRHTELGSTRRTAADHVKLTGGGLHRIDIGALAATALVAAHDRGRERSEAAVLVRYCMRPRRLTQTHSIQDFGL